MIGFDQQFSFASAMAKNFTDAAATMLEAQARLWGVQEEPQPGKSWYRAPAANPFDMSAWSVTPLPVMFGMPWASGPALAAQFAAPAGMNCAQLFGVRFQPWSALATFAGAMAMFEPSQNYWPGMGSRASDKEARAFAWQAIMWPVAQIDAFAGGITSAETPAEFASHRSTGGHAAVPIRLVEVTPESVSDSVH